MTFNFFTSPNIIFKSGAHAQIGSIVSGMGKNALVLHGASLSEKFKENIESSLSENGITCTFCQNIPGEPSPESVDAVVASFKKNACDILIAVGGGSVIDTGKAASGIATNEGCLEDYLEGVGIGRKIINDPAPFVAVPTTHGTGAELTKNGVISSETKLYKKSIRDDRLMAKKVIIDAELMVSLPKKSTASASMDALTQLIEAYVCTKANVLTDALCLSGIEAAAKSIYAVYDTPNDIEARENMAYASMISGICLANAGLGADHGIAPAIGITYGIPHGESCALLLDHVMENNLEYALEKYAKVGEILTGKKYSSEREAAKAGVLFVRDLKKHMGIPCDLKHLDIKETDIPKLISRLSTNSMSANPRKMEKDDIAAFIKALA